MSSQISVFHRSKIIVNQNEWKFNSLKVGAGGEFLALNDIPQVPVC